MFAVAVIEENLDLIAAMNNGVRPLVEVPHAYFVYTSEDVVPYIMPGRDFQALTEHENMHNHSTQVWTI